MRCVPRSTFLASTALLALLLVGNCYGFQSSSNRYTSNGSGGKTTVGSAVRRAGTHNVSRAKVVSKGHPDSRIQYSIRMGENGSYLREIGDRNAFTVVAVIDPITIMIKQDGHPRLVRMLGLDQSTDNREVATEALEKLLIGQLVYLDFDERLAERDTDGTMVAYLFRFKDKLFINQQMLQEGHALATQSYNYSYRRLFTWSQKQAQDTQTGIWTE